jgi:predicted ester cyclase
MPPSGKVTRTVAIQIFRFAEDKIAESWVVRDDLGMLRQLGQLPPLGPNK